jgi:alcohol dehydrogenase (NADP+)
MTMPQARAYAALEPQGALVPWTVERRDCRDNDVRIDITHSGICHSDIHQVREEWGGAIFPMVPGHEIVGTVSEIGNGVSTFHVGQRVGVGVYVDSCRSCANCLSGHSHYCLDGSTLTYNARGRDGHVMYGGYASSIVVDADYVVSVPDGLDPAATAPLLCAGITVYSPLRHWGAGPGKRVAVIGLGGLGHLAVRFAAALGAEVTVLSHSPSKEEDARRLGAHHFVLTSDRDAFKSRSKSFDLILNTTSADLDLNVYLRLLALDGTLVVIGLPGKPAPVDAPVLLDQRRSLAGSAIGSVEELQSMLEFCAEHGIVSDIELISADQINAAYDRVVASDVRYRFVIDTATI